MRRFQLWFLIVLIIFSTAASAAGIYEEDRPTVRKRVKDKVDECTYIGHMALSVTIVPKIFQPYILPTEKIKYVSIHHTEVRARTNSHQLYAVNDYHKDRFGIGSLLGWYIGYSWFVDVNGKLTHCRLLGEETAAQLWHNYDTESICLAGNFNKDMPNRAQIATLRKWLKERQNLEIHFHRDFADRTCPGTNLSKTWLKSILR